MDTKLTELQKLKLELLKMYDGDVVSAKLAYFFIIDTTDIINKYKIKKDKDGKGTFMD